MGYRHSIRIGIRFASDSTVELEHRVDADFPGSLRDGPPLQMATSRYELFGTALFDCDGDVTPIETLLRSQPAFPEEGVSTPLRSAISSDVILQRRFWVARDDSPPRSLRRLLPRVAMVEAAQS